ncbi:Meiotic recombination protein REC114 [Geodia barretti]|uniref:Meiotic recombination protein REC114 n=1 Tax=Geodia barretti TaxID=519541 RepID=A0AA35SKV4_GEOBA|nr:Meiotic recombination protein REC114 [Geodia barretti]
MAANAGEKARLWPVEKYARFVSNQQTSGGTGLTAKKSDGIWQHYSSNEGSIQLALVESNHLMISSGTMIFTDSRRFRVKFAPIPPSTAAFETCRQFSAVMAPVVLSIREMEAGGFAARDMGTSAHDKVGSTPCALEGDSQFLGYGEDFESTQVISETQSSEMPNMTAGTGPILIPDESSLIPVPDIGKVVQTQGKSLGRAYADTNLPTEQLGQFIRLCLTDANFPAFVESVERELNCMTNT